MLTILTPFHVAVSLAAILSGLAVLYGMLNGKRFARTNAFFLITTVLTSATGFLYPFNGVTPGIVVGILSLIILAVAMLARYKWHSTGTYVITAIIALYFNVFVLVVQSFQKIAFLKSLAPTGSEPPFAIAQGIVLIAFVVLGYRAFKLRGAV